MRLRIKLLLLSVISSMAVCAAEPSLRETTGLAESLDDLVQQRPRFHPEHFSKGVRFYAATSFELSRIVLIAGANVEDRRSRVARAAGRRSAALEPHRVCLHKTNLTKRCGYFSTESFRLSGPATALG
jgi:hypothetical protein